MRKSQKSLFALSVADLAGAVRHAEDDLRGLRGSRIFITGGTGFFGKWLLAVLAHADAELALGLRLTVLSRQPDRFLREHPELEAVPALQFRQGDIAGFAPGGERYDFILHAACDTLGITTSTQEEERARATVEGTRRMLDLARRSGARRMLFVSSGAVYGVAAGKLSGAREEDAETAVPLSAYARAKREAEVLCAAADVDTVTGRAFAFLGPHLSLDAHYAAGNFLRDAQRGGPILVRGDGTALRSYLYPADLAVWLLAILVRGRRHRAYNVGSGEVVSTADLARRIAAARMPVPEVIIQSAQPQGPQNIYLPDVTRASAELGLRIGVPLDDAIRRTLAFLG